MTTKLVEMAVRDPNNAQRFVTEMVEVGIVRVNLRNRDLHRTGGHVFNDVISGEVYFKPGEVKTVEISEPMATKIKRREEATWELTSAAPTLAFDDDDDEEAPEPTSSEASMIAAAEEAELRDEPPRVKRVQRKTKR